MDRRGRPYKAVFGGSTLTAISGTRRAIKEMADGTIRVMVDIDPRFNAEFHRLFPQIDTPCAIAPLVNDFERIEHVEDEKPKGGALAKLAGMWCKEELFHEWLSGKPDFETFGKSPDGAAEYIRAFCGVGSRAELDNDGGAAEIFQRYIRVPYMKWLQERLDDAPF